MNSIPSFRRALLPAMTLLLLASLLPLHAQRAEVKPGPPRDESPPPAAREEGAADSRLRMQRLHRQLGELREKLDAQIAAGNDEAAASVKEEMARVHSELARTRAEAREQALDHDREPSSDRRGIPSEERGPRARGEPGPPPQEDVERRLHHLEIAIENLHAAGLHEPAERFAQQAQRMRMRTRERPRPEAGRPAEGPRRRSPPGRPPGDDARERPPMEGRPREGGPGPDAMAPLRQEIRRLHEEIQALHRRMDELSHERR